ncbi:hypothetical protein KAR91_19010 [Candidatus Pacearchaeota archaeon]|nr:hypothetical protein [Candidatus Pacearchaeota archaeon]
MTIVRVGDLTLGNAIVLAISDTSGMEPGMFVYGAGVDFESKILTVDTPNQITMTKPALVTASTVSLEITFAEPGLYLETKCALVDVEAIALERGKTVIFRSRDEDGITRDAYGSVKGRSSIQEIIFKAMPVDFQPTRRALELAGLREEVDVIVCTCKKKWNDLGIDFTNIDAERTTIEIDKSTYEIKEKVLQDQFGEDFLYVVFGAFKK